MARAAFNPFAPAFGVASFQVQSASMAKRCAVCTATPHALSEGDVAIKNIFLMTVGSKTAHSNAW